MARTHEFLPYEVPWYSSRLPNLAYQSEELALTQMAEKLYLYSWSS